MKELEEEEDADKETSLMISLYQKILDIDDENANFQDYKLNDDGDAWSFYDFLRMENDMTYRYKQMEKFSERWFDTTSIERRVKFYKYWSRACRPFKLLSPEKLYEYDTFEPDKSRLKLETNIPNIVNILNKLDANFPGRDNFIKVFNSTPENGDDTINKANNLNQLFKKMLKGPLTLMEKFHEELPFSDDEMNIAALKSGWKFSDKETFKQELKNALIDFYNTSIYKEIQNYISNVEACLQKNPNDQLYKDTLIYEVLGPLYLKI